MNELARPMSLMATWMNLLRDMTPERSLARARQCVGRETVYRLGRPAVLDFDAPLPAACDCSGFVCFALGIPRQHPRNGAWLATDGFWAGGGRYAPNAFLPVAKAEPGDLLVFPDAQGSQGHVGLVSKVRSGRPLRVIHCSAGNARYGDAIRETGAGVFWSRSDTRLVRPDFTALRRALGVDSTGPHPRLILGLTRSPGQPIEYREIEARFDPGPGTFWAQASDLVAWPGGGASEAGEVEVEGWLRRAGWSVRRDDRHLEATDPRRYIFIWSQA